MLPKDETADDFGVCLKFNNGEKLLLGDEEKFGDRLVGCKKINFISRRYELVLFIPWLVIHNHYML